MNKISITIEGSIDELRPVLYSLLNMGLLGEKEINATPMESAIPGTKEQPPSWTEEAVRTVWRPLSYKAKDILKEIWKKPEGYPWDELHQVLGMSPNALGGCLSSLGHQIRINRYQSYPDPLQYVITSGVLERKLHPVWRETISKFIEEEGNNG